MDILGSQFFMTLVDIGKNQIPAFINGVLEFLNTPVKDFFALFQLSYVNFLSPRQDWLSDILGFVGNTLETGSIELLKAFGFDLTLPIWQFIMVNIGLVLGISIVLRLLSILF